jgi:hypothetical protein
LLGNPDGAIFLDLVVQVPDAFKDYKGLENVDLRGLDELARISHHQDAGLGEVI